MKKVLGLSVLSFLAFGGLAMPAQADQTFWGTTVGAGLGGLLGSQFGHGAGQMAYTGLGVAVGGLVGNSIGSSMDRADRAYGSGAVSFGSNYYSAPAYSPNYVAPPVYAPQVIYVPQPVYVTGGYMGAEDVPPTPTTCREYTQTTKIGKKVQKTHGTACLQPDGSWKLN